MKVISREEFKNKAKQNFGDTAYLVASSAVSFDTTGEKLKAKMGLNVYDINIKGFADAIKADAIDVDDDKVVEGKKNEEYIVVYE